MKIAGLVSFMLIWHVLSMAYDALVLPSPLETLYRLYDILKNPQSYYHISMTIMRSLSGFFLSLFFGVSLGVLAGIYKGFCDFMSPFERIMVSVPPIAWLVLTIIWFGGTGLLSATSTVFVSCFPMIYLSAKQGVKTLDKGLLEMGQSFGMSYRSALFKIGGMHILSVVFPSLSIAFGTSWKVGVMAELLGSSNGIGSEVAKARVNLETSDVLAWIVIAVVLFMIADKFCIEPINRYTMRWR